MEETGWRQGGYHHRDSTQSLGDRWYCLDIVQLHRHLPRGTWVAQLVKCPTLDFSWGHGPRVMGLSATMGSMLSMQPARYSFLIFFLSPSAPLMLSYSLSKIRILKKYWSQMSSPQMLSSSLVSIDYCYMPGLHYLLRPPWTLCLLKGRIHIVFI